MKKIFAVVFAVLCSATCSDGSLVISQYVETDSGTTPKGIEIWNPTAAAIDFSTSNLQVLKGTNGGAPALDFELTSGSIAANEVIVVGTSDIGTYLSTNGLGSVQYFEEGFTFNGDDSLVLNLGGVDVDVFGDPGNDPGSAWSGGGVETRNSNIQLLSTIASGTTAGSSKPLSRRGAIAVTGKFGMFVKR
ncbi:hypothetical protein V7x_50690 [Crateriforma conspicua]|uniref:LTD domain-containing protein n=1 Tax=Crateriforma conspicua TaxID=2527996 RepID=A0A5C6FPK7_9PLAN|nr:lamin tail domain-containing protein [Crateriforma conspicua]TWU63329.1 hypothetical protein V7x_50690 [Crateriforma conspicua]